MTIRTAIQSVAPLALLFCSLSSLGQQVHVSPVKGGVVLTVSALKKYELMPSQERMAQLGVECTRKGNKASHLVFFSAGSSVATDDLAENGKGGQGFVMTIDGTKQETPWAPYRESGAFAYSARTEAERVQFMQTLLNAKSVSIEFKPFLTGVATTSTFDLSGLRDAVQKQPDCAMK